MQLVRCLQCQRRKDHEEGLAEYAVHSVQHILELRLVEEGALLCVIDWPPS